MGLLDNGDDLLSLGMGLLAAGGPSATPANFGQRLSAGYQHMMESQKARKAMEMQGQQMEMQKMQMQQAQMQLEELKRARDQKLQIESLAKNSVLTPEMQAIGAGGPTPQAAALIPSLKTKFDMDGFLTSMMGVDPLKAYEMKKAMVKDPIKLGAEETLIDPNTLKPIATGMVKKDGIEKLLDSAGITDPAMRSKYIVQALNKQTTHAPATSVTVAPDNLGLKPKDRFEMEDKLRNDYSKSVDFDQKMLNSVSKLKLVLSGDPNAMKDQASIYSFAKVLDVDGAVRESDYGAILNTAGVADRVKNYLNKLQTGQMLNATQRAEMLGIADAWETAAKQKIQSQQKAYSGRAKMYNLTPENVFQPVTIDSERPPLASFEDKNNGIRR